MKTLKKILSLTLLLAAILVICACGNQAKIAAASAEQANKQMAGEADETVDTSKKPVNFDRSVLNPAEFQPLDPSQPGSDIAAAEWDWRLQGAKFEEDYNDWVARRESERIFNAVQCVPVLLTWEGKWLDQNGEEMSYEDSTGFFKRHRQYAYIAVAVNSLCQEMSNDYREDILEDITEFADVATPATYEYLGYQGILAEIPAEYDPLKEINDGDIGETPNSASIASRIILGKILEFRDNGTYDAVANPHLSHDCEAEGCYGRDTVDDTVVVCYDPNGLRYDQ